MKRESIVHGRASNIAFTFLPYLYFYGTLPETTIFQTTSESVRRDKTVQWMKGVTGGY